MPQMFEPVRPQILPELQKPDWLSRKSDETGSWKVDRCLLQVSSDANTLCRTDWGLLTHHQGLIKEQQLSTVTHTVSVRQQVMCLLLLEVKSSPFLFIQQQLTTRVTS